MATHQYIDIAIVGGGMVGGAIALNLAQKGLSIAVIEKKKPIDFDPLQKPDTRVSSISSISIDLLRELGVWESILSMRAHPYRRIETWEWESARIIFDSNELELPILGYVVENNILQLALWKALKTRPEVTLYVPASLKNLHRNKERQLIVLSNGKILEVRLIIGADGADSQVREMAGIGVYNWQYHQSCMMIIVECENNPGDCTWQHFTSKGPHAFLPLFGNWAALIWYDDPVRIHQLKKMPMMQLQNEIHTHFPIRLGKIRPVSVSVFPLIRQHAFKYILNGLVLVGDAAHTIHPLVGQGLNLGYRDVSTLVKVLVDARNRGEQWTSERVLKRYQSKRIIDNYVTQFCMDLLYASFNSSLNPIQVCRNVGLFAMERAGIVKRRALKYLLSL